MELDRKTIIENYRQARCDIYTRAGWVPWTTVPDRELIVISAWNPRGQHLTPEENGQRDARLLKHLRAKGHLPLRVRGRSDQDQVEEGWLICHESSKSLSLINSFEQFAGLILGPQGRSVLWYDGTTDALDSMTCEIPEAPPASMDSSCESHASGS